MNILNIIEDNFFEVELYHDEEEKYRIICIMDFWYSFKDIITEKEIQIRDEDPYSLSNRGLTCRNSMIPIPKAEVLQILTEYSEDDKKAYKEYITAIEEKSIREYDKMKCEPLERSRKELRKVKKFSIHNKAII